MRPMADKIEPEKGILSMCNTFPSVASDKPHKVPNTPMKMILRWLNWGNLLMGRKYAILRPVWEVKGAEERRKKKEERSRGTVSGHR